MKHMIATEGSMETCRPPRFSTTMVMAKVTVWPKASRSPRTCPARMAPPAITATPSKAARLLTITRQPSRSRSRSQARAAVTKGRVAKMTETSATVV